jgi:hypothetical protein
MNGVLDVKKIRWRLMQVWNDADSMLRRLTIGRYIFWQHSHSCHGPQTNGIYGARWHSEGSDHPGQMDCTPVCLPASFRMREWSLAWDSRKGKTTSSP